MIESEPLFPSPVHDHDGCVRDALESAELHCRQSGARLTDIRRRTLELVWASHAPIGAYALLEKLREEGRIAQPPTIYRALDFLLEQGLIHRVERLNAFIGCPRPDRPHAVLLLLCKVCNRAAELDDLPVGRAIHKAADARGFTVSRQTLEIEGICEDCRTRKA
jgi:Fur family zinc uptake transcriptional regulator